MKSRRNSPSGRGARAKGETHALIAARTLVDRLTILYRDLERRTGAPITVHRALGSIGASPGIAASELAETLGIQRPGVSHALKTLHSRGWIERVRSVEDQRSVRLFVTSDGRRVLDATAGKGAGVLQHCVRRLSDTELDGLTRGLTALLQHLPEARHTPRRSVTAAKAPRDADARRPTKQ